MKALAFLVVVSLKSSLKRKALKCLIYGQSLDPPPPPSLSTFIGTHLRQFPDTVLVGEEK